MPRSTRLEKYRALAATAALFEPRDSDRGACQSPCRRSPAHQERRGRCVAALPLFEVGLEAVVDRGDGVDVRPDECDDLEERSLGRSSIRVTGGRRCSLVSRGGTTLRRGKPREREAFSGFRSRSVCHRLYVRSRTVRGAPEGWEKSRQGGSRPDRERGGGDENAPAVDMKVNGSRGFFE